MDEPETLDTHLPDLTGCTLREVLERTDTGEFDAYLGILCAQVATPRANLGGTGPPGRVD